MGALAMVRTCFLAIIAVLLTLASPSLAREAPILSLDPGGHMSLIRSLVFTADGKQLISAADDKVIRVWDVQTSQTIRTLRGQIGDGNRGKIYALALSPDGKLLAAGGRMREAGEGTHPIRLYDFESGEILSLLDAHQGAVLTLDFSPDGKFLLSAGTDDTAIIWDVTSHKRLHTLRGHTADINRAVFTRDGARAVTGSDDRTLGLWDVRSGKLIGRSTMHAGNIFGVAVSPVTGDIASATQQGELRLSDDRTLKPIRNFARQQGDLLGVSFSADGKRILTGTGTAPYHCRVWDVASGRVTRTYTGHDHLVIATAASPAGRLAATGGGSDNEIRIWNMDTGKLFRTLRGAGQSVWAVGFSPDGKSLAWGHSNRQGQVNQQGPLEFMLRLPEANRTTGEPRRLGGSSAGYRRELARTRGAQLEHKPGGNYGYYAHLNVVSGGKVRAVIERNEKSGFAHNAYTFSPNGKQAITGGGNGWLTAFDTTGRKLGDFIGHTSDIWAVAVSGDGRYVISGGDDQTLRLWNAATRENVVTLFYGQDGEWILWTPQGYYAASPSGDKYVGWQINMGEDKAARFVTASQLKRHFYRPDIIRRALELASARAAISEANNTDFALGELITRSPPIFSVTAPVDGSGVGRSPTDLILGIGANLDSVEGYDVSVNGRRVISKSDPLPGGRNSEDHEVNFQIPLSSGENEVEIVAYNAVGKTAKKLTVEHTGEPDLDKRGTLYILSIGVDIYENFPKNNLDFAEIDAISIVDILKTRAGPLHNATETRVLTGKVGAPPTAENIRKALAELDKAGPRDTVIVFFAGHGINEGSDYVFLPTDALHENQKFKPETILNWRDLHSAIESARGQRILLMDTCYSGNAYNARLIKDAADDKIAVLTATDAETLAQEHSALGHGVFTYSILEGLKGKADLKHDGRIQTVELSEFVKQEVVKITKGKQTPTSHFSSGRYFVLSQQ